MVKNCFTMLIWCQYFIVNSYALSTKYGNTELNSEAIMPDFVFAGLIAWLQLDKDLCQACL